MRRYVCDCAKHDQRRVAHARYIWARLLEQHMLTPNLCVDCGVGIHPQSTRCIPCARATRMANRRAAA